MSLNSLNQPIPLFFTQIVFFGESISDSIRGVIRIHYYPSYPFRSPEVYVKVQQRVFCLFGFWNCFLFKNFMWFSHWVLFVLFLLFRGLSAVLLLVDFGGWPLGLAPLVTLPHCLFPVFKLLMFRNVVFVFFFRHFCETVKKLRFIEISLIWIFEVCLRLKSTFRFFLNAILLLLYFYSAFILFPLF
mgnify:CR=1 FL=1